MEQQGLYSIALQISSAFVLFTTAFRMAWDPLALSIMREERAPEVYARMYTGYVVGMGVLSGCLALFAKPVLIVLTPAAYHTAFSLVFILNYAFLMQMANNILGIGIAVSARTKYISYAQTVAFTTNTVLNFALIAWWHAAGAAWALAAGVVAQSIAYYYFAQRLYPIPYQYKRMHLVALIGPAANALAMPLLLDANLLESVGIALLFSIGIGLAAISLGLTRAERSAAYVAVRRLAGRRKPRRDG